MRSAQQTRTLGSGAAARCVTCFDSRLACDLARRKTLSILRFGTMVDALAAQDCRVNSPNKFSNTRNDADRNPAKKGPPPIAAGKSRRWAEPAAIYALLRMSCASAQIVVGAGRDQNAALSIRYILPVFPGKLKFALVDSSAQRHSPFRHARKNRPEKSG